MPITLRTNIASLKGQRQLGQTTELLTRAYERLSSGQRINRASDDAAGLAIANDLQVKTRVYSQGIRNGSDGISALTIADSALENLSSVVARIRELAAQAANGTYSNKQRASLDKEAQALKAEFFRISKTTSFNGVNLLDGSLDGGLRLQLGFGINGSINTSVGGAIGTGSVGAATSFAAESRRSRDITLGDLNGDGILDLVTAGYTPGAGFATVRFGTGTGSFGAATSYASESSKSHAVTLGDLNGDGILDLITAGRGASGGVATVRLGTGDGSFGTATSFAAEGGFSYAVTLGDLNGDGTLDLVTAGSHNIDGIATVRLGTGNGSFGAATSFLMDGDSSYAVALGDLNRDGILDLITAGTGVGGTSTVRLGTGTGLFGAATSYAAEAYDTFAVSIGDLNGDGILDMITAGDDGSYNGFTTVRIGTGNGTFSTATSYAADGAMSLALTIGDLNGDGALDIISAGYDDSMVGTATIRLGNGNGTFRAGTSYLTESSRSHGVAVGDLSGDGVLDLVTAGYTGSGSATVRLGITKEGLAPLLDFSLKSKADALQAMGPLQRTQENLAKQRGVIGAYQSRVGVALNILGSGSEAFSAAESRIRDADIAADAAQLTRTQILQKAAASVLAQANQQPALALRLLVD